MELELIRTYLPEGTNGVILYNQLPVCCTIELPWKENKTQLSCIPEGRYEVVKRYSLRFKAHFMIKDVAGRSLILMHPANNARKELKGCIAPVLHLTGEGKGSYSKAALTKLFTITQKAFAGEEAVFITIKSVANENNQTKSSISNTEVL